jgi:sortase (surface protein transpeptidase)
MPLTGVALDPRGDMELPPSPKVAGWYRYGPAPGSEAGAAVIAAHVDTPKEGVGPLEVLEDLEPGTVVVVRSGTRLTRYVVQSVRKVGKGELDLDALFARDGPPRLHLVTCGGEFDRRTRQYADNVVAVAVPLADAPPS